MHAKPDLRVLLKWMITGSGSVITDVIRLNANQVCMVRPQVSIRLALILLTLCAFCVVQFSRLGERQQFYEVSVPYTQNVAAGPAPNPPITLYRQNTRTRMVKEIGWPLICAIIPSNSRILKDPEAIQWQTRGLFVNFAIPAIICCIIIGYSRFRKIPSICPSKAKNVG